MTMEQIYNWNPEMIFVTNFTKAQPDDLYNNTIGANDWNAVNAVKNKRVIKCRSACTATTPARIRP